MVPGARRGQRAAGRQESTGHVNRHRACQESTRHVNRGTPGTGTERTPARPQGALPPVPALHSHPQHGTTPGPRHLPRPAKTRPVPHRPPAARSHSRWAGGNHWAVRGAARPGRRARTGRCGRARTFTAASEMAAAPAQCGMPAWGGACALPRRRGAGLARAAPSVTCACPRSAERGGKRPRPPVRAGNGHTSPPV